MGKLLIYAVAAAGLTWSLFAYGQFALLQTPGPMLLASIAVLAVSACAFVRYDIESMFGDGLDRPGGGRPITPIIRQIIMRQVIVRQFLIPTIVVVGLLLSHVSVGRFVFGLDAVPMLLVLSVVFVASVCGLIDRDAQIIIGRRA